MPNFNFGGLKTDILDSILNNCDIRLILSHESHVIVNQQRCFVEEYHAITTLNLECGVSAAKHSISFIINCIDVLCCKKVPSYVG